MNEPIEFGLLKQAGEPTRYPAGTTIFRKGDLGHCMFFVVDGGVDIVIEGRVVDYLAAGEVFGEMALIDKQARSADAVARIDSSVIRIDEERFLRLIQNTPVFALQVMRLVAARLRHRLADVEALHSYLGLLQG